MRRRRPAGWEEEVKRTVKAWAIRNDEQPCPGSMLFMPHRHGHRYDTFGTQEDAQAASATYIYARSVVPCTITYDDGQPAPHKRKRKGGAK